MYVSKTLVMIHPSRVECISPDDEQFPAARCQHHRSSKTPNQFSEMYSSYYASGVLCNSVDGESSDEDGLFDL